MEEAGRYFRLLPLLLRNPLHAGNSAALKRVGEEGHTSNYPRVGDDEGCCCENLYQDY